MKLADKHLATMQARYPKMLDVTTIINVTEHIANDMLNANHTGYDAPYDEIFPTVIYFVDNSVMVISATHVSVY